MTPDRSTIQAAMADPAVFAEVLVGEPLWPHQQTIVHSSARIRCVLTGRQAGKSRTLAIEALHTAFAKPGSKTLVLSAGDDAAKDLLAEVSLLGSAPWLGGSVIDDTKSQLVLSNGSVIRSIPASIKQARGKSIDLLILDEACFIDREVWKAARYTIIARPSSRVLMASTPHGPADGFFAVHWRGGQDGTLNTAGLTVESFHWPSTVSPMVDTELLELWRKTSTDREYRAEVLAEWPDEAGAYFTAEEIHGAVVDDALVPVEEARGMAVVGGVDWGFSTDSSAVTLVAGAGFTDSGEERWRVVFVEEAARTPYSEFIDRLATLADYFSIVSLVTEQNGVGQMPTQVTTRVLGSRGVSVEGVHTTLRLKEDLFGTAKMLLQQGRLQLPRHPALLAQLEALEFETTESGALRIAVPERRGHDDIAMSFALTMLVLMDAEMASDGGVVFLDEIYDVDEYEAGKPQYLRALGGF